MHEQRVQLVQRDPCPPAVCERPDVLITAKHPVEVRRADQAEHGEVGLPVAAVRGRIDEPGAAAPGSAAPGAIADAAGLADGDPASGQGMTVSHMAGRAGTDMSAAGVTEPGDSEQDPQNWVESGPPDEVSFLTTASEAQARSAARAAPSADSR